MRIGFKQIKKSNVETASGVFLGHVADIEMDTEGQAVVNYHVRRALLGGDTLLISRNQIVRFEEGKIIVDDNAAKEFAEAEGNKKMAGAPEPVAMRQIES